MSASGNTFLAAFSECVGAQIPTSARKRFDRAQRRFRKLNIRSCGALLREYESLSRDEKFVALCLFQFYRFRDALPLLFREISSRSALTGGAAAAAIVSIGGDKVVRRLIVLAKTTNAKHVRSYVLSVLGFVHDVDDPLPLAVFLTHVLADPGEDVACRASAADGLAGILEETDRRTTVYRAAIKELMGGLDHSDPELRFCCVHTLGELRVKQSLKQLHVIAKTDNSECPGTGKVSSAARRAIKSIRGNDN